MFTSRAEFRILLRQDNADVRLTQRSFELGLASKERVDLLNEKYRLINEIIDFARNFSVKPKFVNSYLNSKETSELKQGVKLVDLLLRPQVSIFELIDVILPFKNFLKDVPDNRREEIIEGAEIAIKYDGYISREKQLAEKLVKFDDFLIEDKFNYAELKSVSTEGREKLQKIRPKTIGQAKRIPGVSPSDINVLLVLMGR